jgi:hypothetical protein
MPRLKPFWTPTGTFHWPAVERVHPRPTLQLLILLVLANGAPVVAKKILGERLAYPLDGGVEFVDGRPLLADRRRYVGLCSQSW